MVTNAHDLNLTREFLKLLLNLLILAITVFLTAKPFSMAATVSVHETGDAIGIAVANILSSDSSSSIAARHVFTMAISGGSQASLLSSRLVEMVLLNISDKSFHVSIGRKKSSRFLEVAHFPGR